jgi:hypothetical protein
MLKIYTGIGSRKTPMEQMLFMTALAKRLDVHGFHLRSGGAMGADTAFQNGSESGNFSCFRPEQAKNDMEAHRLASSVHPAWNRCSSIARNLHARNCYQILGIDLLNPVPSAFVVCWTPNGADKMSEMGKQGLADSTDKFYSGTDTAIKIALTHDIPVFNLRKPDAKTRLYSFLKENYSLG